MICHPGVRRMEETLRQHYWWPKLREAVKEFVQTCAICQKTKRKTIKYGKLPPKEAEVLPWDKMCVDLIGPYKIRRKNQPDLKLKAVTMIDPATGWFEMCEYDDKRSITVANIVETQWLSRYPWPTQITLDRGSEFIGQEFKDMIKNDYGIKRKPITVRNPQANAIVERVHQVLGNMVRTFELEDHYLDAKDPWKGIISAVSFAIRSTIHTTTQKTPAQLVFGRDMILNVQHIADWQHIKERKQALINKNNERENRTRHSHVYKQGDQILLRRGTENKYEVPYSGPHLVLEAYDNGTLRIQKGAVAETINIRRATPFHESHSPDHGGECNEHPYMNREQPYMRTEQVWTSPEKEVRRSNRLRTTTQSSGR